MKVAGKEIYGEEVKVNKMKRPGKIKYYLDIAKAVSMRATCLRRQFGAIIVVDDQMVASGYCGAPREVKDCLERDSCLRKELGIPSGEKYELCRSVHAEQNAIINAARAGANILGGDMYIWGYCQETKKVFIGLPCLMCLKIVVNAGLERIYYSAPEEEENYDIIYTAAFADAWSKNDIFRQ